MAQQGTVAVKKHESDAFVGECDLCPVREKSKVHEVSFDTEYGLNIITLRLCVEHMRLAANALERALDGRKS